MKTSSFHLVRHLPTAFNRDGLLQGRRDIPITAPDAATTAAIVRNRARLARAGDFDAVLASTLMRTQMTAERYGRRFRVEPLLDELDFGPFEGRPKAEMIRELGPAWVDTPHLLTLGEPLSALQARVQRFIAAYADAGKVLVFGHGAWMRAFVCLRRYGSIEAMNSIEIDHNDIVEC